jgi:hypothetical protein
VNDGDDQADFSDAFCAFLQSCVTSVDAAELLLVLSRKSTTAWSAKDLARQLGPMGRVSDAEATRHIEAFQERGLVSRMDDDGRVHYQSSADVEMHVQTLARLYLQRPVTLFRVIYALRDTKIKTLADAFRIWRK